MSQILIEANQILLINDVKPLFNPVSFKLYEGQHYQLIGINGVGKSSLLKAIHSSVIDEGSIQYHINKDDIGYLPHNMAVYEQLTLDEQLKLFNSLSEVPEYFENIIEKLIPKQLLGKQMNAMSQGEKQRACLVLLLCFPLKIVLLDEPSSHQDTNFREHVNDIIQLLLAQGITILETTHRPHLDNLIALEPFHV